jgi:hypothetical protein
MAAFFVPKSGQKEGFLLDTFLSGSTILQDGKIIGAVTHVLVDDPTREYGGVETMLGGSEV